jgi:dTDP-4-amino-4,6-dideoxygalactose transaminase
MTVPFLDLKAQYSTIRDEINTAIQEVLDSCAFAGGPFVERFEKDWAAYCGVKHAIGVGNGTDALWHALLALGVGQGDEVITVSSTFMATAEAISLTGATPVFVDILDKHYTMDPELLERALSPRTKAVIPVHLFGQTADMDPIMEFAKKHGLVVVEDACQAHGALYKGRKAGSIGDVGCFSFYPGKNLGAYGEAGAIVSNRPEIDAQVRMFRDHGQKKKYYHDIVGWNGRMDGIQGAILSVKLRRLDAWNDARREVARKYTELLSKIERLTLPREASYAKHVYHVFAIRVRNRNHLMRDLLANEIHCGIHYPVPTHLQNAYRSLGFGPGSLPITETCAEEFLSLPMFPELSEAQISHIVQCVRGSLD